MFLGIRSYVQSFDGVVSVQEIENHLGGIQSTAPMHRQPCSPMAVVVNHLKKY